MHEIVGSGNIRELIPGYERKEHPLIEEDVINDFSGIVFKTMQSTFKNDSYLNFPYTYKNKDIKEDIEKLKTRLIDWYSSLKNQVVIDLHPASNIDNFVLSCLVQAKAYIAIEPVKNNAYGVIGPSIEYFKHDKQFDLIPYNIINTHALDFLLDVPQNSISLVSANPMHFAFIYEDELINSKLKETIIKTLDSRGVFLEYDIVSPFYMEDIINIRKDVYTYEKGKFIKKYTKLNS